MTKVVAALIWKEGRFLICKRPASKARGLLWEFVGGKVEKGESEQEALIRECHEELDIIINPTEEYLRVEHIYPDITIELILFSAVIVEGQPKLLEHEDMKWITPPEIDTYEFCPADCDILAKIKNEYKMQDLAENNSKYNCNKSKNYI